MTAIHGSHAAPGITTTVTYHHQRHCRCAQQVAFSQWVSNLGFFQLPGYLFLWVAHRVVICIFWVASAYSATLVGG